jgi:hypothetical protein
VGEVKPSSVTACTSSGCRFKSVKSLIIKSPNKFRREHFDDPDLPGWLSFV